MNGMVQFKGNLIHVGKAHTFLGYSGLPYNTLVFTHMYYLTVEYTQQSWSIECTYLTTIEHGAQLMNIDRVLQNSSFRNYRYVAQLSG